MAFLFVWFVGDITNMVGAIWAHLVPVIIAIGAYFCLADGVLIGQCLYYNARNARRGRRFSHRPSDNAPPTPTTPLLGRRPSDELSGPPSRRRRSSASWREHYQRRGSHANPDDTLAKIVEETESGSRAWIKNGVSVLAIAGIGIAGWTMAWQAGLWKPQPAEYDGGKEMAVGAQVLGYFSAICYLGYVEHFFCLAIELMQGSRARLPQIYKNFKSKSCEGKSAL